MAIDFLPSTSVCTLVPQTALEINAFWYRAVYHNTVSAANHESHHCKGVAIAVEWAEWCSDAWWGALHGGTFGGVFLVFRCLSFLVIKAYFLVFLVFVTVL